MPEGDDERLTVPVRFNLTPTEFGQVQAIAAEEDRPVAAVCRRAVRDMLQQQTEVARLRVALAAYRATLRAGGKETQGLRLMGDVALGPVLQDVGVAP